MKSRKSKLKLYGGGTFNGFISNSDNYISAIQKYQESQGNNALASSISTASGSLVDEGANAILPGLGFATKFGRGISGALKNTNTDVGNVLGSVLDPVGTLTNFITGTNPRKDREAMLKAQQKEQARILAEIKLNKDKAELSNFPTNGLAGSTSYFKYGGIMRKSRLYDGGKLVPLAKGVDKAVGASHENGGIQLPTAEIEGKEVVVDDNKVLSNRIDAGNTDKSFAEIATKIANTDKYKKYKASLEAEKAELNAKAEKLKSQKIDSLFAKNSNKRQLQGIEKRLQEIDAADPIQQLFQAQEQQKVEQPQEQVQNVNNPNKQMGDGGLLDGLIESAAFGTLTSPKEETSLVKKPSKFLDSLNTAAEYGSYFIDNIKNSQLLKQVPVTPQPNYYEALNLKKDININPALETIDRTMKDTQKSVEKSSNDSNVNRAYKASLFSDAADKKGSLIMDKQNKETELINIDIQNKQNVFNKNMDLNNDFKNREITRENNILGAVSNNYKNLSEDLQTIIRDGHSRSLDNNKMAIIALQYKDSGVAANLIGNKVLDDMFKTNPELKEQWGNILKDRPADLLRFNQIYGTNIQPN